MNSWIGFTAWFDQTLYSVLFAFLLSFRHLFLCFFFLFFTSPLNISFFLLLHSFVCLVGFFFRYFSPLSLPLFSYIFPLYPSSVNLLFYFFLSFYRFLFVIFYFILFLCCVVVSLCLIFSSAFPICLLSAANETSHSILNEVFSWY